MKFLLVFAQSGDVIPFESLNDTILEFYIDYLNTHNLNEFVSKHSQLGNVISQRVSALNDNIREVNEWIEVLLDKKIKTGSEYDYLNQDILNAYHADWVGSQSVQFDIDAKRRQYDCQGLVEQVHDSYPDDIRFPMVGDVMDKLERREIYDNININIHNIEGSFDNIKYKVKNQNWVQIKNPFLHQGLSQNIANLKISFNHLGRTLYDKFLHQDTQYQDENTYNELLGFVDLNLLPPENIQMSTEYEDWCKKQGRSPLGNNLNLGNIVDLDKRLTDYRIIIYRNLLTSDSFSIQLN
jgi:hypothetical protein